MSDIILGRTSGDRFSAKSLTSKSLTSKSLTSKSLTSPIRLRATPTALLRIEKVIGPGEASSDQFLDRRIARPSNGIQWDARLGLASMAPHLPPTIAAVEALSDCRRGLRRPAKSLPCAGRTVRRSATSVEERIKKVPQKRSACS
jgi:hypothetical protein